MAVQEALHTFNIAISAIKLGEVTLEKDLTTEQKTQLKIKLQDLSFELIDDKKSKIIEKIKNIIVKLVHYQNNKLNTNLSELLSEALHHDYSYLSNLFKDVEGTTIEKYFIAQKIEKVKELLVYDELSLNQIAFQLHYSSVAYLSSQFKKITGLTPSQFKKVGQDKRKPLDKL
jgi:AraC-like DNA-binding protein